MPDSVVDHNWLAGTRVPPQTVTELVLWADVCADVFWKQKLKYISKENILRWNNIKKSTVKQQDNVPR